MMKMNRRLAVGRDECGTEIHIEMSADETLDSLRERYPECCFGYIKEEDIDFWHNLNEQHYYNPQEDY